MAPSFPKVRVAVSQHEPKWEDLAGCIKYTCQLIEEAAKNGAQIVAFSELWIPGFPWWINSHEFRQYLPVIHKYMANSMTVDGPEMMTLRQSCKANSVYLCFGFSERDNSSLYMSTAWINPDGEISNLRRKIKPTFCERAIFGDGTGDTLTNVFDSPLGRLGSLECWEHLNPLLKFHTYAQHEQIHVACWPNMFPHFGFEPFSFTDDATRTASQMYAIEGGCFVLLASQVVSLEGARVHGLPGFEDGATGYMTLPAGGCTIVYGPDGRPLTDRIDRGVEQFVYSNLDLADIDKAKCVFDPVGHYNRNDLLRVVANKQAYTSIHKEPSLSSSSHKLIPAFEPATEAETASEAAASSSSGATSFVKV